MANDLIHASQSDVSREKSHETSESGATNKLQASGRAEASTHTWGTSQQEPAHLVMTNPYESGRGGGAARAAADAAKDAQSKPDDSNTRHTPSIGMAWSTVDGPEVKVRDDKNSSPEEVRQAKAAAIAKHDIAILSPDSLGLKANNEYKGLATGYTKESEVAARELRAEIRKDNPNTKVVTEIRYRDAAPDYLPADSPWWSKDKGGDKVVGWQGKDAQDGIAPSYLKLNFKDKDFQNHVVEQAKEAVKTGATDGIMLDWFNPKGEKDPTLEKAREDLVTKIREAIGPGKLIIVNSNMTELPKAVNDQVNGYYMEVTNSTTPKEWKTMQDTLDYAEKNTRFPHATILETWPDAGQGREELHKMRATTTLAATHAPDAASLFADRDGTTQHEHGHDWYDFWNTDIGKPIGPLENKNGASVREYQKATVVSNPPGNGDVTMKFDEPRESAATGEISKTFVLHPHDGDFYKKPE